MKITILSFLFLFSMNVFAQFNCQDSKSFKTSATSTPPINNNGKSDTIDILHIDLDMDMTLVQSAFIKGTATLTMRSKVNNVTHVNLDFLTLHLDSIKFNDTLSCTYNFSSGPRLPVVLPKTVHANDTFTLSVYYYGGPVTDASGWGGFHFANPYYFNLGVGFDANPHTFGRAWFPCFDNFVERQTFTFRIKTSGGRKAYCNGMRTLLDTTTFGGDTVVSHWEQLDEIPSYLTSIAISSYEELWHTHKNKPTLLLARAPDTSAVKSAFSNLDTIYSAFVKNYGPYNWQKVGFAMTTIGAMEHATSVHFPISAISSEDIIAHELAHHWFGNLITCETAGDMWINEGLAEYLSEQYLEEIYDRETYMTEVVDNHSYVVQYAAVADGGHFALFDLPNELTYGKHTYQKGAMIGHNLRGYLGDSLFFSGLTQLLSNNKFKPLNSYQFRDQLSTITGYNLTSFFDDWIFNPGYPDFDVDSFHLQISSLPENMVTVRVSQRMLATNKRFKNVPLQITLHDILGNEETHNVLFTGADTNFIFISPYNMAWANINENDLVLTAVAGRNYNLKTAGTLNDSRTKMRLTTGLIQDSVQMRIEHHWAGPSISGNENFRVSASRYWRVSGALPVNFQPSAQLEYSAFKSTGNLDADLLQNGEDSLMLVYRADATEEWREYPNYIKNDGGNPTNKVGNIYIDPLIPGEYAFANGESKLTVHEEKIKHSFTLFPNPASDVLHVSNINTRKHKTWQILDVKGIVLLRGNINSGAQDFEINIDSLNPGAYLLRIDGAVKKFFVQ